MKILTRDDTEHEVEYVTKADAMAEINSWREYATDACTQLRCERDELHAAIRAYRDAKGRYHTQRACERLVSLLPE